MSTCFRLPIASTTHPSSVSSSPSFQRRSFRTHSILPRQRSKAKPHLPPIGFDNDPFISRLASVAENSPERLIRPTDLDALPFLDFFDSPLNMATPAQLNFSAMEVNVIRPFVTGSLQTFYKLDDPELIPESDRKENRRPQAANRGPRRDLRR